jgi:hypothetical protein
LVLILPTHEHGLSGRLVPQICLWLLLFRRVGGDRKHKRVATGCSQLGIVQWLRERDNVPLYIQTIEQRGSSGGEPPLEGPGVDRVVPLGRVYGINVDGYRGCLPHVRPHAH